MELTLGRRPHCCSRWRWQKFKEKKKNTLAEIGTGASAASGQTALRVSYLLSDADPFPVEV